MTFYVNQACLIFFNVINAFIDAHRILKNKSIAHAINFSAYAIFAIVLSILTGMQGWKMFLFFCSAFFNRQLSFDITLNLRRGLRWDYQSIASPPSALMDRLEVFLFSNWGGRNIAIFYFNMFLDVLVVYNLDYLFL